MIAEPDFQDVAGQLGVLRPDKLLTIEVEINLPEITYVNPQLLPFRQVAINQPRQGFRIFAQVHRSTVRKDRGHARPEHLGQLSLCGWFCQVKHHQLRKTPPDDKILGPALAHQHGPGRRTGGQRTKLRPGTDMFKV